MEENNFASYSSFINMSYTYKQNNSECSIFTFCCADDIVTIPFAIVSTGARYGSLRHDIPVVAGELGHITYRTSVLCFVAICGNLKEWTSDYCLKTKKVCRLMHKTGIQVMENIPHIKP